MEWFFRLLYYPMKWQDSFKNRISRNNRWIISIAVTQIDTQVIKKRNFFLLCVSQTCKDIDIQGELFFFRKLLQAVNYLQKKVYDRFL